MSSVNQKPISNKLWLMPNVDNLSVSLLLVIDAQKPSTRRTECQQSYQIVHIRFVLYVFMISSTILQNDVAQFVIKKLLILPIQKSLRQISNYFHCFLIKINRDNRLWQWYLVIDILIKVLNTFVNNVRKLFVQLVCLMNIMDIIWCQLKKWEILLSKI